MNKIVCLMSAFVLLTGTFSCSEKKDSKTSSIPAVSELVTEDGAVPEPVVSEFREFSPEEFNTINVNTELTDRPLPLVSRSFMGSDLDLGERIPPCKDEKYRDRYIESVPVRINPNDGYVYDMDEIIKGWEESLTEPEEGTIRDICVDGPLVYLYVIYDEWCDECHECSIYRYNVDTDELTEIFRHSDGDKGFDILEICTLNGEIFVNTIKDGIFRLDESSGQLEQILEGSGRKYSDNLFPNDAGKLIVRRITRDTEPVDKDYEPKSGETMYSDNNVDFYIERGSNISMSEYDLTAGSWNELYSVYESTDNSDYNGTSTWGTKALPDVSGELISYKEKPEGSRKYDLVTDEYRLHTSITNFTTVYAGRDRVILSVTNGDYAGSTSNKLHVFDLASLQHYVLDISNYGSMCCALDEGVLVYSGGNTGKAYYIMPELGLTFPVDRVGSGEAHINYGNMYNSKSDCVLFMTSYSTGESIETDENGNTYMVFTDHEVVYYWYTAEEKDE